MSYKKKRRPSDPTVKEQKRVLTEAEIIQLEAWSRIRHPVEDMAKMLGMSKSGLEEIINRDDRARNAVEQGRAKGRDTAIDTLFRMSTLEREIEEITEETFGTGRFNAKGEEIKQRRVKRVRKKILPDPGSLRFWLQTQEGFKITDKVEHTGPDGKPIRFSKVKEPQTEEEILAEIAAIRARREAMKVK